MSKSEGELKKRIRERNKIFPIVCDQPAMFELDKILDQVAKEFRVFSLTSPTGEATVALYELSVKWFGFT